MTFAEAAMIMMSSGENAVIKSLSITKNGKYEAPKGIDGYNPIDVAVPDRYNEGYADGYKDGFDEGYSEGDKDGRAAQKKICDEEKENLINRIAELEEKQGYTLPDGTNYDDICNLIGGDTVIDETIGYGVSTETVIDPDDPTRQSVSVIVVDSTGKRITGVYGVSAPIKNDWRVENIYVHNTGHVDMTFSYISDGIRKTVSFNGYYSVYLDGFGSEGNNISIRNV